MLRKVTSNNKLHGICFNTKIMKLINYQHDVILVIIRFIWNQLTFIYYMSTCHKMLCRWMQAKEKIYTHTKCTQSWQQVGDDIKFHIHLYFFFMFVHQPPRYRNLSFSSVCRSQKRKKKDVEKCTWNIMLLFICYVFANVM